MFKNKCEPENQEAGDSGHANAVVMLLLRVHFTNS